MEFREFSVPIKRRHGNLICPNFLNSMNSPNSKMTKGKSEEFKIPSSLLPLSLFFQSQLKVGLQKCRVFDEAHPAFALPDYHFGCSRSSCRAFQVFAACLLS